jgi:DNA (cytosine-5)-methyltransferase 1
VLRTDLLDFDPAEHPESYDVDLLSAELPRVKSSRPSDEPNQDRRRACWRPRST